MAPSIAAAELVCWARCGRFRRHLLRSLVEALTPQSFASFSRMAPLEDMEIGTLVQQQLQANLTSMCQAPLLHSDTRDAPSWLLDGPLLRRFWKFGVLNPYQLCRPLAFVIARPWLLPIRVGMFGMDLLRTWMSHGSAYLACQHRCAVEYHHIREAFCVLRAIITAVLF